MNEPLNIILAPTKDFLSTLSNEFWNLDGYSVYILENIIDVSVRVFTANAEFHFICDTPSSNILNSGSKNSIEVIKEFVNEEDFESELGFQENFMDYVLKLKLKKNLKTLAVVREKDSVKEVLFILHNNIFVPVEDQLIRVLEKLFIERSEDLKIVLCNFPNQVYIWYSLSEIGNTTINVEYPDITEYFEEEYDLVPEDLSVVSDKGIVVFKSESKILYPKPVEGVETELTGPFNALIICNTVDQKAYFGGFLGDLYFTLLDGFELKIRYSLFYNEA